MTLGTNSKNDSDSLPLVSIFLTTYNHEKYIEAAIKSSLSQTYKNIEILISDAGSDDSTYAKVLKYEALDPRVRILNRERRRLLLQENHYLVLSECKGKYVVMFSGDDILYPHKVEIALDYLELSESNVLFGHVNDVIDEYSNRISVRGVPGISGSGPAYFFRHDIPCVSNWVIRRDKFPADQYMHTPLVINDFQLALDIVYPNYNWYVSAMKLGAYRVLPNSVSRRVTLSALADDYFLIFTRLAKSGRFLDCLRFVLFVLRRIFRKISGL